MSGEKIIQIPSRKDTVLDNVIRCQRVELRSIDDMPVRDLFFGFDRLQAVTFSASAEFIDRIVGLFGYSEIILGAEFLIRKDAALHDAMYQALAGADLALEVPGKYSNIRDRMQAGALALKAANVCLDHRKLYIMSADDGRTRVVIASANMSARPGTGTTWSSIHTMIRGRLTIIGPTSSTRPGPCPGTSRMKSRRQRTTT